MMERKAKIQISNGRWEYSRIQSNYEFDSGGSGKYLKKYGLEGIGYNRIKGTLYEFSGINYQEGSKNRPGNSIPNEGTEYTLQLPNTKSGEGRNINDAGGRLLQKYWDLYTNEQLRENVDLPTVSTWWYNEFFELNQTILPTTPSLPATSSATATPSSLIYQEEDQLIYRNELYEYTVNGMDIVLISREK